MLWTIGVFALNFGPVIVGPILDYVGPKLTAIFGKLSTVHNMPGAPSEFSHLWGRLLNGFSAVLPDCGVCSQQCKLPVPYNEA